MPWTRPRQLPPNITVDGREVHIYTSNEDLARVADLDARAFVGQKAEDPVLWTEYVHRGAVFGIEDKDRRLLGYGAILCEAISRGSYVQRRLRPGAVFYSGLAVEKEARKTGIALTLVRAGEIIAQDDPGNELMTATTSLGNYASLANFLPAGYCGTAWLAGYYGYANAFNGDRWFLSKRIGKGGGMLPMQQTSHQVKIPIRASTPDVWRESYDQVTRLLMTNWTHTLVSVGHQPGAPVYTAGFVADYPESIGCVPDSPCSLLEVA